MAQLDTAGLAGQGRPDRHHDAWCGGLWRLAVSEDWNPVTTRLSAGPDPSFVRVTRCHVTDRCHDTSRRHTFGYPSRRAIRLFQPGRRDGAVLRGGCLPSGVRHRPRSHHAGSARCELVRPLPPSETAAIERQFHEQRSEADATIQGFNIGINAGEAAGQTIFHCPVHLIPRRSGDVESPRRGVRHVIPASAWVLTPTGSELGDLVKW